MAYIVVFSISVSIIQLLQCIEFVFMKSGDVLLQCSLRAQKP
jgi:hypothetical protein